MAGDSDIRAPASEWVPGSPATAEARGATAAVAGDPGKKAAVVLDTNVFYGDVYARKRLLSAVLDGAAAGDFEVVVPEVVVLELARQFPEKLTKVIANADKSAQQTAKEFQQVGLPSPPPAPVIDAAPLIADYEVALRARLSGLGTTVAPHPDDLTSLIRWSVAKRKPFKITGEGLPDATIWLSVLGIASKFSEVLFVSENAKDFASDDDDSELAPALLDDLVSLGLLPGRVRLVPSLTDLVDRILPPLADADARAARLLSTKATAARLATSLRTQLLYALVPQEELDIPVDLPADPRIGSLTRIDAPELLSARLLPESRLLLGLTFAADVELDLEVPADDVDELDEARFAVAELDREDRYASATMRAELRVTVQVVTDFRAEEVSLEQIDYIGALPDFDRARRRITESLKDALRDALRRSVEMYPIPVRDYTPPYTVEGTLDAATAHNLHASDATLDEVIEFEGVDVRCQLVVAAEVDVEWLVVAPTPTDLETYGHMVEGDTAGGGWLGGTEAMEPVEVIAEALISPEGDLLEYGLVEIRLRPVDIDDDAGEPFYA